MKLQFEEVMSKKQRHKVCGEWKDFPPKKIIKAINGQNIFTLAKQLKKNQNRK